MKYITDRFEHIVTNMRTNLSSSLLGVINTYNKTNLVAGEAPFFMYGHPVEIAGQLMEKDKDKVYKYKKYPCVILRMDIQEDIINGLVNYNLNLAIVNYTDQNYIASQRVENVFKPILHPLYELFFKEVQDSGMFVWTGNGPGNKPPHSKIDRLYYGRSTANKNEENIFTDPLDAVEILNLRLSAYECGPVNQLL